MAPAQSKPGLDRLSALPPELLSLIFSCLAGQSQHTAQHRQLCLISKVLLPFASTLLYSCNRFYSFHAFSLFVGALLAQPSHGPLVRGLGISFRPRPGHRAAFPAQLADPRTNAAFWTSLSNLEWIDLSSSGPLLRLFLDFEPPAAVPFTYHALSTVHINSPEHGWSSPFALRHYRRLFARAPGLVTLTLSLPPNGSDGSHGRDDAEQDGEDGAEQIRTVKLLRLQGDTAPHKSDQIASFVNHFVELSVLDLDNHDLTCDHARIVRRLRLPNLTSLRVSEEWEPAEIFPFAPDLSAFPSLAVLEVDLYRICDPAWLASAPPTLKHITTGPHYITTVSDLRALLAPGARRPASLQEHAG